MNSSSPVTISVVDKENKPLFINYKQSMVLTPTEYKGNPIPLIATTSSKYFISQVGLHVLISHLFLEGNKLDFYKVFSYIGVQSVQGLTLSIMKIQIDLF